MKVSIQCTVCGDIVTWSPTPSYAKTTFGQDAEGYDPNVHITSMRCDRCVSTARAYIETQKTISDWANSPDVFGPAGSNARVAARANEEMAELLRALTTDDNNYHAHGEMADIVIILYRLAERMGSDLNLEIDKKMSINRKREWKRDGTGHGYHVREGSAAAERAKP